MVIKIIRLFTRLYIYLSIIIKGVFSHLLQPRHFLGVGICRHVSALNWLRFFVFFFPYSVWAPANVLFFYLFCRGPS